MFVYFLQHEYEDKECDCDRETDIAVYSTFEKANQAKEKWMKHPKFIHHPEGFTISEYEVDGKGGWPEGFKANWED